MDKFVFDDNYPQILHDLAENLDMAIPKENMAGREAALQGLMGFIAGL